MKTIQIVFAGILLLLLVGCVGKATHQQKVNEAELLSEDVARLSAVETELRRDKQILQADLTDLNARMAEVLQQNSRIQRELLVARSNQQRQEGELLSLQQQLDESRKSIDKLQRELDKEQVAREARLAKVRQTYEELVGALEEEIERGELTISNLEGKLTVNLLNQILFSSGETQLRDEGKKVLRSLGDVLARFPDRALQIAGHTDNVPISSSLKERYPTNWELSTARATSVIHFLQQEVGLPGDRLIAAGLSQYQPVATNNTPEGRSQNRRIEILLVPMTSELAQ